MDQDDSWEQDAEGLFEEWWKTEFCHDADVDVKDNYEVYSAARDAFFAGLFASRTS